MARLAGLLAYSLTLAYVVAAPAAPADLWEEVEISFATPVTAPEDAWVEKAGTFGTYPGVNSQLALPVTFYTAFNAEMKTPYNIGFDAQAVHGVEHTNGQLISVGHSWEAEDGSSKNGPRSAFVVAGGPVKGEMQWYYNSNLGKVDEGVVAVMQIDGNNDMLAAGFRKDVGGKYRRWLIRLAAPTTKPTRVAGEELPSFIPQATLVWEKAFGPTSTEKPSTHSTFESIAPDGKGGVLLGGLANNPDGQEFKFKSAGNVPAGDAFAWHISKAALEKQDGPEPADITWQYITNKWTSIKAIRTDTHGNAIAALHRERESKMEAGLVNLGVSKGKALWGPTFYPKQTEGTDLAVAPDGSGFVVTGHGSTVTSGPAKYLGRLTRVDAKGEYLWTKEILFNTHTDVIYNECWGVQPNGWDRGENGWILSCGTGIENDATCKNKGLSADLRAQCTAGFPAAWGGKPRMPSVWSNMVPAFSDSVKKGVPGELLWSTVNSFDQTSTGSSAAEFISPCQKGGFYVTTDEVFGAGLLRLGRGKPTPTKPGKPGKPSKPGKPGRPGKSGKSGKPGRPGKPGKPDTPALPEPHGCMDATNAGTKIKQLTGGDLTSCEAAKKVCHDDVHWKTMDRLCPRTCGVCD